MQLNHILTLFERYYAPALMVIGGLILGLLLEKILISRLIKLSTKTKWKSDDILLESMRNLVWPLFLVGGILLAIHNFKDLPVRVQRVGDATVSVAYILLITIYFSRILSRFVHIQTYDEQKQGTSTILMNLVRVITLSVGVMIALQSLGISIQPLLTALGITGLAVALALQSTLTNFFSGLHIIASKRVRPGDYIRIDQNIEGYVSDINWRSATIQQLSGNMIILPNSRLAEATVINTYLNDTECSIGIECNVSYDSDLETVESLTLELAREFIKTVDGCVRGALPVVRFQAFQENSIKFSVFIRIKNYPDQYRIRHEFIKVLHKRFREEGIVIASLVRSTVVQDMKSSK